VLGLDLLVRDDAARQDGGSHRHVLSRHAELVLVVRLAGHAGVDGSEQGIDVGNQFLGDRIGRELSDHGIDQLTE
jgi:hypothetical protein